MRENHPKSTIENDLFFRANATIIDTFDVTKSGSRISQFFGVEIRRKSAKKCDFFFVEH